MVKPARSWVQGPSAGERLASQLVVTEPQMRAAVEKMRAIGSAVIAQEWASGRREAVWSFYVDGRFSARWAQVAHRMIPLLGGTSVVRESIPVPTDIGSATHQLIEDINLEGFSEVEFRRNAFGEPLLMEINPRLSASVELAVRAGVDFPYLMYQWAAGEKLTKAYPAWRDPWLGGEVFFVIDEGGGHGSCEQGRWLADPGLAVGADGAAVAGAAAASVGLSSPAGGEP